MHVRSDVCLLKVQCRRESSFMIPAPELEAWGKDFTSLSISPRIAALKSSILILGAFGGSASEASDS